MYFPVTKSLAILAAIAKASAWSLAFYDNVDNCDANDSTQYQFLEGNQANCYTFGASMPGVSCEHFTDGGVNSKGCRGLFKSTSVAVSSGNCHFYGLEFCGSLDIIGEPAECRSTAELLAGPGDFIRSFRCQNDE